MIRCLGCGIDIRWLKGFNPHHYTCFCGSTVFVNDSIQTPIPITFMESLIEDQMPPHIDYYVGKSDRWNQEKEDFINTLQSLGATWSWECCDKCRNRVLERTRMELKGGFYKFSLHPKLQKLIEERPQNIYTN